MLAGKDKNTDIPVLKNQKRKKAQNKKVIMLQEEKDLVRYKIKG